MDIVELEIQERLMKIFIEKYHIDKIDINFSNKSVSEMLNLDSLAFMQFICAVEQEFDICFRDDVLFEELNNLNNLIQEIEKEVKNRLNR